MPDWWPCSRDPAAAMRLIEEGVRARGEPESTTVATLESYRRQMAERVDGGGILVVGGRPVGAALWRRLGPLGLTVNAAFLAPEVATGPGVTELLGQIERRSGPVAFVTGPISHLAVAEEGRLMAALGFEGFERSEMRWPADRPVPSGETPPGWRLRTLVPADEPALAKLHLAAYRGRFDWYLFLEDTNDEAEARRHARDMMDGRWGELLAAGSCVAEGPNGLGAAVVTVRRPEGVLIVDVMVDPTYQGHGLGRAALGSALAGLTSLRAPPTVLNVTEGNRRAVRLYEGLGFVRSLGPSQEYYHRDRVPARALDG